MNLIEAEKTLASLPENEWVAKYAGFARERLGSNWFEVFRSPQELIDDVAWFVKAHEFIARTEMSDGQAT